MKKLVLGSLLLIATGLQPLTATEVQTLPPAIYAQMKTGKQLGKVWFSNNYDVSKGFTIGTVTSQAEGFFANSIDYFPYALKRLAFNDSPYALSLTVIEFSTVDHASSGIYAATIGVEGTVKDQAGELMMAFRTREEINNRDSVLANCQAVMDKIVWSISKDLGKPWERAAEIRSGLVPGQNRSGLVPLPPPAPEPQLDLKGRLLRLEDLRQKGLITNEEYTAHKAEILKGL
jgi:hypothetical protein